MDNEYPKPNVCLEFVSKAYAMVDDSSTDSIISWSDNGESFIVWNEAECCKNLLPRLMGIPNFTRFISYGFKRVVSGHMEFARDDFVRGKPELLEKIGKEFEDMINAYHEKKTGPLLERMMKCKSEEEKDLVAKEYKEKNEKERRVFIEQAFLEDIENFMRSISMEKERRAQALVFVGAAEEEAMFARLEVKRRGEKRKRELEEGLPVAEVKGNE